MADFKTHLNVGAAVGFVLSVLSYFWGLVNSFSVAIGVFLTTAIGSFLPDTDSDVSLSVKIIFSVYGYLAAWFVVYFLHLAGFHLWFAFLMAVAVYIFVYFVLSKLFRKYTRHRGIFHSIPAALIVFFLTLLVFKKAELDILEKFALALGSFVGYLSHLILDEIYSMQFLTESDKKAFFKAKRSLGTALDLGFKGNSKTVGIIAWILVFVLFLLTFPMLKQIYFALL